MDTVPEQHHQQELQEEQKDPDMLPASRSKPRSSKVFNISSSQGASFKPQVDNIVKLMKQLDLYKEGESREKQLSKFKNMSELEWKEQFSKLRLKKSQEQARENGPHEEAWWFDRRHKERLYLLEDVLFERLRDDSEDGKGNKLYIKERCPQYAQLMRDIEKKQLLAEQRRDRLIRENGRLKDLGRPLMPVPEPYKVDKREISRQIKKLEENFYKKLNDQRENEIVRAGFGTQNISSQVGGHDPNHPSCWQQLNISINNYAMNVDRRIEMGIIAQRQRRRFNQVRKLGGKVPSSYKRIFRVTGYPKVIQDALVKYPDVIEDDSSYEDDEEVVRKYTHDPLEYIRAKDDRKRDAIEMNAEPYRIRNARTKRGDKNYKDLADHLSYQAVNVALAKQGMPREMTEERRWGKHIKNEQMLDRNTYQKGFEEELAAFIDNYCREDPEIFKNDRSSRDKLLAKFEIDVTILSQYPQVLDSMYMQLGEQIPGNLKPVKGSSVKAHPHGDWVGDKEPSQIGLENLIDGDQNDHKASGGNLSFKEIPQVDMIQEGDGGHLEEPLLSESNVSQKFDQRSSREEESNRGRPIIDSANSDVDEEPHDDGAHQQQSNGEVESHHTSSKGNDTSSGLFFNQDDPEMDRKVIDFVGDSHLDRDGNAFRSKVQPAHDTSQNSAKTSQRRSQKAAALTHVMSQRDEQVSSLWKYLTKAVRHSLSKLTQAQIDEHVPPALQKNHDESSNLIEFEQGGLSQPNFLEQIDELKHPLLKAKHRLDTRYIPKSLSKNPWKRERKSHEVIDIDGEEKTWGQFKKDFEEDLLVRTSRGEVTKKSTFVLRLGTPREKLLEWHYKNGFRSEDSDDEMTVFKRTERQYYRALRAKHGEGETLLYQRKLEPFEKLLLECCGGNRLLKDLMGKDISDDGVVYDYQIVEEKAALGSVERPEFLTVPDRETFNTRYSIERDNQANAMNGNEHRVKRSIFAGELLQIYELIRLILRADPEDEINNAIAKCLPVHGQKYSFINLNELVIVRPTSEPNPKAKSEQTKISGNKEPSNQEGLGQEDPIPFLDENPDVFSNGNHDNTMQQVGEDHLQEHSSPERREPSILEGDAKVKLPIEKKASKMKPIFVETQLDEYRNLKRRLLRPSGAVGEEDGETQEQTVVSTIDHFEMAAVQKQEEMLSQTDFIETRIIPRLKESIRSANGSFSSFHLWDQYDPEAKKSEQNTGFKHMALRKRGRKAYVHRPGNMPITFGGVQIGMMITRVPWLVPEAFEGLGLPLNIMQKNSVFSGPAMRGRPTQLSQAMRNSGVNGRNRMPVESQGNQAARGRLPANGSRPGKKRARPDDQDVNHEDQDEVVKTMQMKLDFLRQVGQPDCPFELVSCARAGNLYSATIKFPHNRVIQQKLPLSTKLLLRNYVYPGASFMLEVLQNGKSVPSEFELKSKKSVLPGSRFNLHGNNSGKKPCTVQFSLSI